MLSPKNSFPSPPSASSSPCDSPLKDSTYNDNFFKNFGGDSSLESRPKRRLTRQSKLRHVSDAELGLRPIGNARSQSLPYSRRSPSPRNLGHWSSSAVPQPLPLPGPKDYLGFGREMGQSPSRGEGNGNPSSSAATGRCSSVSQQTVRKITDHVTKRSSKSPTCRRRGFCRDQNAESYDHNFRLNVPSRSAPVSGFSSPALSPQRFNTVNLFHSSYAVPQEFQASVLNRPAGLASQMSPTRMTPTPDHSPLRSPTPQSPHRCTRNPIGVVLHSHHKSLPETSTALPEGNNTNVHPLPLPPGISRLPLSTTIHNLMDKSDVSSTKDEWWKGKLIGHGTYGSVYEATNSKTGALCAMKEVDLIPDDPKAAECIKQLAQEIKILQNLKHPNIVQYYGSEVVENRFCIYLEYVHPGSINKYVREHCGAMTESIVRNFTRHILSGLVYLHSTKTIHRDIKGANLLVDACGVVKLADFGLAKHLAGQAAYLSLKGSPHWMAPEVLQAVLRNDAKPELALAVDIWSMGCTVIEMLTGKPPWSEFTGVQAMFSVLNKSPPIPETLSVEGKDFLQCCFKKNPADRPSALVLLEHPFIRNSHGNIVSVCSQEFSGLSVLDASYRPKERIKHDKDLIPGWQATWIRNGNLLHNGETCPPSSPECLDSGATSRHSPRSTLEVLPSISSPELHGISNGTSPPSRLTLH